MNDISYAVSKTPNKVTIQVTQNDRVREFQLDRAVFDVLESCTSPTRNGDLQLRLATAMRISSAGGKCSKAASLLERYTHGYRAFNGHCALMIGTSVGNKRFFQFNPSFTPFDELRANMLSKLGKSVSDIESDASRPAPQEDLDVPEDFEMSSDDMNQIIDQAYEILGYNPNKLPDDAPDLTFAEAQKVLSDHE